MFTFSGEQEKLDVLDISNAVSVDLAEYKEPGTYDIPVEVNLPQGITLTSQVTVQLTLEDKSESTENGSSGQGTDGSSSQENTGGTSGQDGAGGE